MVVGMHKDQLVWLGSLGGLGLLSHSAFLSGNPRSPETHETNIHFFLTQKKEPEERVPLETASENDSLWKRHIVLKPIGTFSSICMQFSKLGL